MLTSDTVLKDCALRVTIIFIGNGFSDPSSNPGQPCLRFILR